MEWRKGRTYGKTKLMTKTMYNTGIGSKQAKTEILKDVPVEDCKAIKHQMQ